MKLFEIELINAGYKPTEISTWILLRSKFRIESKYYSDGSLNWCQYKVNGRESRGAEGPSYLSYYKNGQLNVRRFAEKGLLSRNPLNGPAFESFFENGKIYWQEYKINGRLHRDQNDGPAVIRCDRNGQIIRKEYWENGKQIFK